MKETSILQPSLAAKRWRFIYQKLIHFNLGIDFRAYPWADSFGLALLRRLFWAYPTEPANGLQTLKLL